MLKLYLNENISWRIARTLREYGFDVISSHEANMNKEDDSSQFAFAVEQKRTVVTNNFSDFVTIHNEYLANDIIHYGIIFTTKYSTSNLIIKLRKLLTSISSEQMINQIRWLNEFN